MLQRFQGDTGRRLRFETLLSQKLVARNPALAEELADRCQLQSLQSSETLFEQDGADNDVYMILAGSVNIIVNGRIIARRTPNDHVGEMAAIEPTQRRSASIVAAEETILAKITEAELTDIGGRYPEIYRCIAKELSRRLLQRNSLVNATRDKIHVFIISSVESLNVARTIQNAFAHDPFVTTVWTDGVFKVTNYTLQSLEEVLSKSDFAIAIAHSDDSAKFRGVEWPTPRDNVIFELGLFMGHLGRHRAILMEPRDEGIKLPSDLAGITTIPYRYEKGSDIAAIMGPACNALREHILHHGPNN